MAADKMMRYSYMQVVSAMHCKRNEINHLVLVSCINKSHRIHFF